MYTFLFFFLQTESLLGALNFDLAYWMLILVVLHKEGIEQAGLFMCSVNFRSLSLAWRRDPRGGGSHFTSAVCVAVQALHLGVQGICRNWL
ncbi:hypothetical protein CPB86DRAFT_57421 [Serendipita vermifera]|nr:hypothetical protein CPB86DRAFT_57421 [Serendipita vermifera]